MVVAAVVAVFATWFLMSRHIRGFRIRVAGLAPRAARFAGVRPETLVAFCLGLSGALAGMAGPVRIAASGHYPLNNATHLVWATGGGMVPEEEMAKYLAKGR